MSTEQTIDFPGSACVQIKPIDWASHTMGPALLSYLELKVHSLIQQRDWHRITVIGQYDRSCMISAIEKNDKQFNWHRPTAEICGNNLIIKCFPGCDYVYHYALMTSTFLALRNRFRDQVYLIMPDADTCVEAVNRVNLDLAKDEVVILGWGITQLAGFQNWTFNNGYGWKRVKFKNMSIIYIGFLHSIWGDVSARLVLRFATLGARRILYVGKVGTLDPTLAPNCVLATGSKSLLGARQISWDDFFGGEAALDPLVISGDHITSSSTLLETQDWLVRSKGYMFVDPEIGHMGAAAFQAGLPYGYLHVVSNNLARQFTENLSNERLPIILARRALLLDKVKAIIENRLHRIASNSVN